jgi:putative endopeptidase
MKSILFAGAAALSFVAATNNAAPSTSGATRAPGHYGAWGLDLTTGNSAVAPGDDFFAYTEGSWYAKTEIPADQASTGVDYALYNRTQDQLLQLIKDAAREPKTPVAAKVGGLYEAFMDEARIEALDDKPLQADLVRVSRVNDKAEFTELMAHTRAGFGQALFALGVIPDPQNPEINTLRVGQGGLGLPDRDYYLTDGFKAQKAAYRAYIERTFTLAGWPTPAANADAVLALETRIAEASWAAADRRDRQKTNNLMTPTELQVYAPGLNWKAYLAASDIRDRNDLIVREKSAVQKIAAIYAETPLDTLKAWEAFHIADAAAPYMSKRFVDSRFEFTKALYGVQTLRPRWKRGVALVNDSLGQAVGQAYVARYFPPSTKAAVLDMVANLKTAMAARIEHASWMSPATKTEALRKLARMDVQVGYPDKWRDYSGLKIDATDLYGDVRRSNAFEWAYALEDLGRKVDHKKWVMPPQTDDAYNGGFENRIVFPAGILQSPFFDASADPAVNYGAAGQMIGHEITHGFDDQGRKIDDTGALRDWWAPEDAKRFEAEAAKLGAQYDAYEPAPGFHINGKLTMGENIADLGGLLAALDAYHASLHGKPAPVIDGLTGDQRFFLAFAQGWRLKVREDTLKQQLASNPHSPAAFRLIGTTRNVDAWYSAFGITSGKYYLKPDDRVRIW